MTRESIGRAVLIAVVAAAGVGGNRLVSTDAAAQGAGARGRSVPTFEVDQDVAEGAGEVEARRSVEHRDRRAGQRLGPASTADAAQARRAPRWRRRPSSCSTQRATTSRPGAATATAMNGREREHGIHIDNKGFVWLGGNNCPTNGMPGPQAGRRRSAPEVYAGRQVRHADRQSNQSKGNDDTRNLHRPADVWVHRADQRVVRGRRLWQSPRRGLRCRIAAPSSGCGARSATSRWTMTTARS